jgi:hypothetical protein
MREDKQNALRARKGFLERLKESKTKDRLEATDIFNSVDDLVKWSQTVANIKLRDRLVWFLILSSVFEGILVLLNGRKMIELPYVVLMSVSASMSGSLFGLGGLLIYIARDLYPGKGNPS